MDARIAFRIAYITIAICGTFFAAGYGLGRETEQEATRAAAEAERVYVNDSMRKAGFCKWINQSRIMEECQQEARP